MKRDFLGVSDNAHPLFFILGPCALESESHAMMMAEQLSILSSKLSFNFIFKASYDKANRQSINGYRSMGMDAGLKVLERIKREFNVPIVTDIHESWQAEPVSAVADVLQIPAFLCRQTDLLSAAGKTERVVFIKKGQFATAYQMKDAIKKVQTAGGHSVWLGERGFSFGYNNLVVDYRNFPIMKSFNVPVLLDATHAVQRPGAEGASSGCDRHFVASLTAAAIVQGIAGLFLEVHDHPEKALSDGPNSIRLSDLYDFLSYSIELDAFAKTRPVPVFENVFSDSAEIRGRQVRDASSVEVA